MSTARLRTIAALLALGIAGAAVPGAGAASSPEVTLQDNGTAHVSWRDSDGASSSIQERSRLAGGALGDIYWISAASQPIAERDVAGDAAGNAVHVWTAGVPAVVRARRRLSDGSVSAIQTLSATGVAAAAQGPRVALDGQGNAVVVWHRNTPEDGSVVYARRRTAGGILGPVLTLSAPNCRCTRPQVAVDPAGTAFVVWQSEGANGADPPAVHMRRLGADGSVGAIAPLSSPSRNPKVGVDSQGNAIFGWVRFDGKNNVPQLKRRSAGGAYSPTQTLYTSEANAADLRLAVSPDGSAFATWVHDTELQRNVRGRHRAAHGTLGSLLTLSGSGGQRPQVAMDAGGNALVVWERFDGATNVVEARRRSASGAVSAVQPISPGGDDSAFQPAIDIDSSGHAVIAWQDQTPSDFVIKARRRHATGALSPIQPLSY